MTTFRILSENFFNLGQFPSHTISTTTDGTVTGEQEWRIGTGRRRNQNRFTHGTTGDAWVRVTCDQVRAADMIALDGINFAGSTGTGFQLQYTNSTGAGWNTRFTVTIPTKTYANTRITDTPGATASDGLWVHRFATTANMPAATDWRLYVPAFGTAASIGLAWLGRSVGFRALRPFDDETKTLNRAGRVKSTLSGSLSDRLSDVQGELARYHVGDLAWADGSPFIIVPNDDQAERAQVGIAPDGTRGMPYPTDWPTRVLSFDWVEHQPKIR